jgi:hypothetical protein
MSELIIKEDDTYPILKKSNNIQKFAYSNYSLL